MSELKIQLLSLLVLLLPILQVMGIALLVAFLIRLTTPSKKDKTKKP